MVVLFLLSVLLAIFNCFSRGRFDLKRVNDKKKMWMEKRDKTKSEHIYPIILE